MICSVIAALIWAMTSAVHWFDLSMLLIYDKRNSFKCNAWSLFSSLISNMIISASSTFDSCQNDHWSKDHVLFLSIKWSLTEKLIVYHLFRVLHQVLLQLSRSISWQVLLFCFMTIRIWKHSWFVQFSTIIWFWIEIISSIEFSLAFDSCFESESDLDQLSDHLLDQLLLTAAQICLSTIASDADIAFDHRLLQLTWRLTFWSARRLSDSVFPIDIWSWSYIQITSQLI